MPDSEKYLLLNLKDEQSKKVAESIANKTARKILDYLSSKEEAGAEEISKELAIPLSTIDYNLKNLKRAGLVETKHFLWSSRGKKILLYKVAKKLIIIVPKTAFLKEELKRFLPFIGVSAIISLIIEYSTRIKPLPEQASLGMEKSAEQGLMASAPSIARESIVSNPHYGLWFFAGVLIVIAIYLLIKSTRKN